jgi:glycosyltransferase involved in cell wall biosynthesis
MLNKDIFEFYNSNPLDIFVNVSSSEGLPVSIMEAQSCGIPAAATAVGGTPETVTNENGILLEENPDPVDTAKKILALYKDKETLLKKKKLSRSNWETNFNAASNYPNFANELAELLEK